MTEAAGFRSLIPDTEVRRDLGVTKMTTYRWDRDPRMAALGWPPPIKNGISNRNSRNAARYAEFKARMAREAIARRDELLKQQATKAEATV